MRTKSLIRLSAPLVLLAGLAASPSCKQEETAATAPPPEVLIAEVTLGEVPIVREWVGETRGEADIEIRARVPGFLEGIHFREGGRVTRGQLLYTIDPSELKQAVAAAEAGLAQARTLLANAAADVGRYRPLAAMNAISVRDLENAVAKEEAAEAQVNAAEANLRLANINLSYAEVRSPMDGLIGLTRAKVGDFVGQPPNPTTLNTVSDVDPILVRFAISEREYLQLARAYPRAADPEPDPRETPELDLLLADGSLYSHKGRTRTVDREIDADTGTLTLEAAFPNPDGLLRPGQYGKVRAVVDRLEDALLVPQRAVQELQGQFQVWVIDDSNTAKTRFVEPGPRMDELWVITTGLEAGERVVAEGFQRLRSGMTVSPKPYDPPTPEKNES